MQARSYVHRGARDDMLAAVRYCQDAIAQDPNYALAYAGLADAYAYLGARAYIAPMEGRRKAEEAARKALSLDDNLAEAHAALGQANIYFTPSNFVLGDQELRRAIELDRPVQSAKNLASTVTRRWLVLSSRQKLSPFAETASALAG